MSSSRMSVALTNVNMDNLSRRELLEWVNSLIGGRYKKVEEMCTGVAYCRIMHMLYPDDISMKKVKMTAHMEHEQLHNWKLIQQTFARIQFNKTVPIDRLLKGRFQDNLEFLQWFKRFYDTIALKRVAEGLPLVPHTPRSAVQNNSPISNREVKLTSRMRGSGTRSSQRVAMQRGSNTARYPNRLENPRTTRYSVPNTQRSALSFKSSKTEYDSAVSGFHDEEPRGNSRTKEFLETQELDDLEELEEMEEEEDKDDNIMVEDIAYDEPLVSDQNTRIPSIGLDSEDERQEKIYKMLSDEMMGLRVKWESTAGEHEFYYGHLRAIENAVAVGEVEGASPKLTAALNKIIQSPDTKISFRGCGRMLNNGKSKKWARLLIPHRVGEKTKDQKSNRQEKEVKVEQNAEQKEEVEKEQNEDVEEEELEMNAEEYEMELQDSLKFDFYSSESEIDHLNEEETAEPCE